MPEPLDYDQTLAKLRSQWTANPPLRRRQLFGVRRGTWIVVVACVVAAAGVTVSIAVAARDHQSDPIFNAAQSTLGPRSTHQPTPTTDPPPGRVVPPSSPTPLPPAVTSADATMQPQPTAVTTTPPTSSVTTHKQASPAPPAVGPTSRTTSRRPQRDRPRSSTGPTSIPATSGASTPTPPTTGGETPPSTG